MSVRHPLPPTNPSQTAASSSEHRQTDAPEPQPVRPRSGARPHQKVRRQGERSPRNSEKHYRALFEQSFDAICVVSLEGAVIEVNNAFLRLFGYSPEDIPSLSIVDVYAAPSEREDFLKRIDEKGFVRDSVRMKRKNGSLLDCERTVVALKDDSGRLMAYQGILHDISERVRVEEARRQSEAYVRSVLDNLPIGIAVNSVDPTVTFEYMNDYFPKFYRTTREALAGPDAFWDAVYEDPEFRAEIKRRVLDDCASGDPERMHWEDIPITRKGERTTFVSAHNTLVPESGLMLSTVQDMTARTEAELAAEKSERHFRYLFDNSLNAIFLIALDETILEANDAALKLFQYSRRELASVKAADLYANPASRELLLRRLAETGCVRDEVDYKRKDGAILDCHRTVIGVKDESGAVMINQVVIADATELKQAKEQERIQRGFADALIETSPACILVFDSANKVVFANPETDRVLGIPRDRIVGMTCGEDFILLDRSGTPVPEGQLPMCRVLLTEQPQYSAEYAFDSPTGRRILSISAVPLYDDGSATRVVATLEDITARSRAEEALRESEARYRHVVESSNDIIYAGQFGDDMLAGQLELVSPTVMGVFGLSPEALQANPKLWFESICPEDADALSRTTLEAITHGHPVTRSYRVRNHLTKEYHWLEDRFVPQVAGTGRVVGFTGIAQDVTQRIAHEREQGEMLLRQHRALLATVEAMSAAVEMRDPYTAGHQQRVTTVARSIAEELSMKDDFLQCITVAGQVHDLGKLRIPAEILTKPGKLTDTEFQMMKEHPRASYDLLKGIDFPWPIAEIALQHHERVDGSGYPQGLKGKKILPEARILAVADVFEAMSSHRPYRPALGVEAALAELESKRGILYDRAAVDACVRMVRDKGFTLD